MTYTIHLVKTDDTVPETIYAAKHDVITTNYYNSCFRDEGFRWIMDEPWRWNAKYVKVTQEALEIAPYVAKFSLDSAIDFMKNIWYDTCIKDENGEVVMHKALLGGTP